MGDANGYWFPAKRVGWGWGPPISWQGWAAVIVWLLAFVSGIFLFFHDHVRSLGFLGYVLLMSAVFLLMCYIKGEPPRWRSGG
jgi:hypothetical protein